MASERRSHDEAGSSNESLAGRMRSKSGFKIALIQDPKTGPTAVLVSLGRIIVSPALKPETEPVERSALHNHAVARPDDAMRRIRQPDKLDGFAEPT
jgi:hypothetical protein